MGTATFNVASGSTLVDLFAFLQNSIPTAVTPPHQVFIQNAGSGSLRLGDDGQCSTAAGLLIGPGEDFHAVVPYGRRLSIVSDGGSGANNINAAVLVGRV